MALDYRKCAVDILAKIGGRENLIQATHCATRLRLLIKNNGKVEINALRDVEGVKGLFENDGQLQIIIGTGTVNKVYDEFVDVAGIEALTEKEGKKVIAARQPVWKRILKALGDVFVPVLPAIVASGLMVGLVEAIGKASPGFSGTSWYDFLYMISNTAFTYLPVLIAISAAKVFGGNLFLGAVIGLAMIHSNLMNAWSVAGADNVDYWNLLFFHVRKVGYQGHVIPVIIAVWIMCFIEKKLHKIVPEMLDLFVTPLCTVLSTTFLTFTIIGPIFAQLESWVMAGAEILVQNPLGAGVMGALYPVTVVMGLHHMYNVIETGMLAEAGGLNTWMTIASAANFAQFGACLAVGIRARNKKTKSVAIPSAFSAALGITEPAIFGVNMRFFRPFIAGMIGGGVGAVFGAVTGIGATAYGVTGIPGYLTIDKPLQYTILLAISGGVAFVLSMFLWRREVLEEELGVRMILDKPEITDVPAISCSAGVIGQPVPGKVFPYDVIPDPAFSTGALGEGVGIEPEMGAIYAPVDGKISSIAESKHAIGIEGPNGMEILIHVGIDTVSMKGEGFVPLIQEGDMVKKGDRILEFDRDRIKAEGHPDTVVMLLTNSDDYENVKY